VGGYNSLFLWPSDPNVKRSFTRRQSATVSIGVGWRLMSITDIDIDTDTFSRENVPVVPTLYIQ